DAQRVSLGLTVRRAPSKQPPPSSSPYIRVRGIKNRNITVELMQDGESRGKPDGVAGAVVFTHIGPTAPATRDDWTYAAGVTRTIVDLPFGPSDTGDTVWISAFWRNAKDES